MKTHLPGLIVFLPLLLAIISPVLGIISPILLRVVVLSGLLGTLASSIAVLIRVLQLGEWHYYLGGWLPPWGIEYLLDPLSAGIAALIAFISLVVALYSGNYLQQKTASEQGVFYALLLLIITGLLGMTISGDVFNVYVFLEISSLATYALVASDSDRGKLAAFRYLIIGTVAGLFYLLGVGYLYAITGTLNMADLAEILPSVIGDGAVILAAVLIVAGLGIKMALFPFHGWLPDTYSYGPVPLIALISSLSGKVAAYVIFRILFFVIGIGSVAALLKVLGWMAAAGIIAGSIMAIAQKDFRRMLGYSSVAQMGYIALGLSLGNTLGLIGALLHILNHALMKSCLFLISGGLQWRSGFTRIEDFMGLSRRMPLTMAAFVVAALSMIGIPPMGGFFSKWYLALGAIEVGAWPYVAVILASSLLNAVYFFRIIEHGYLKKEQKNDNQPKQAGMELPFTMLLPVIILGTGVLLAGLFSEQIVSQILYYALPWGAQ